MRTVGPLSLIVGQPNTINDPAQQGGNPSEACQIQNSSSYQLTVIAAGDTLSIQPFTAQTVAISGQPITVTPITSTGSGTCAPTFAFLLGVAAGTGVELPDGTWIESPPQQDGPLTAAAIVASNAPPGIVFGPTAVAVPASTQVTKSVTIPTTARTLIIAGTTTLAVSHIQVTVQGNQSGLIYRTEAVPYLQSAGGLGFQCIVPVSGVIDNSVTITLTQDSSGTNTVTMTVAADSTEYTESVFYNGQALSFGTSAANSSALVLTGPARLLTAYVEGGAGTAGSAQLQLNGQTIGRIDIATGGAAQSMPIDFPPNTILPSAQQLTLVATALVGTAGVSYAYP